jgi:hypothetical protein
MRKRPSEDGIRRRRATRRTDTGEESSRTITFEV